MILKCRCSWANLTRKLENSGRNPTEIRTLLNPLRQLAARIVGDESGSHVIEDCALCLLLYFLDKEDVTSKDLSCLGFGIVDLSIAKEVLKAILYSCLNMLRH